jgi:hypothetical protein
MIQQIRAIEQKIIGLSAKEIIMAMVNGLRKRHVCVDMSTFGHKSDNGVCFGCAATNTLIEVSGISEEEAINTSELFLSTLISGFEKAIDCLRCGDIYSYNIYSEYGLCIPEIVNPESIYLPALTDDYTEYDLQQYERLANSQYC